ncbi:MAG: hypothetical protein ACJ75J_00200 [Cytophagaceae bacterium]
MTLKKCILVFFLFYGLGLQAQTRFKLLFESGVGYDKPNFFTFNHGLLVEKKLDINKSIETGWYGHEFGFYIDKKNDSFYQAFIKNTKNEPLIDSINRITLSFKFVTIPIGFNYYISPKTYINYRIGFNFFSRGKFLGERVTASEDVTVFTGNFQGNIFRKFYTNHMISFNWIMLRRIDMGFGFWFTPAGSFIHDKRPVLRQFNNEISRYFASSFHMKIFLFQAKTKKI